MPLSIINGKKKKKKKINGHGIFLEQFCRSPDCLHLKLTSCTNTTYSWSHIVQQMLCWAPKTQDKQIWPP